MEPRVIVKDHRRWGVRYLGSYHMWEKIAKHIVRERDKNTCQWCGVTRVRKPYGREPMDVAHIIPLPYGPTTPANMRILCPSCNRKESKLPWMLALIAKLEAAGYAPVMEVYKGLGVEGERQMASIKRHIKYGRSGQESEVR